MKYDVSDIQGWMSDVELGWLFVCASGVGSVVEIGSWKGRSTHALLSGCAGPVIAVDHFNGSPSEIDAAHAEAKEGKIFDEFTKNVGHFKNLTVLQMSSEQAASHFQPKSIDMVFIDGDHVDGVRQDITLWKPVCKVLLCGHDWGQGEVKAACKELLPGVRKARVGSIWQWRAM
jgi:hypothetical protein